MDYGVRLNNLRHKSRHARPPLLGRFFLGLSKNTREQRLSEQEVTVEIQLTADLIDKLDRLQQEFGLRSRSVLIQKLLEGVFNEDEISIDDL